MGKRQYYSTRTGKHPTGGKYDLPMLRDVLLQIVESFERDGYFQEALGYDCIDAGEVEGYLGPDVEGAVFLALRKRGLWPLHSQLQYYDESDVFDMIEFLHEHVSYPVEGRYHSYNDCGMHYHTFDTERGRCTFRDRLNPHLRDYSEGYEISEDGDVVAAGSPGLAPIFVADVPPGTPPPVRKRLGEALHKFRRHGASREERREAVRGLADVLEYLRGPAKKVLRSKDENDLFELANRFGIRHHNEKQKTDYDELIWLTWMFYYYLATIHALIRLLDRSDDKAEPA